MRNFRNFSRTILAAVLCAGGLAGASPALAKPGGAGWQTPQTITIPTGSTDAFEHAYCPTGFSVVRGAAFAVKNTTLLKGFIERGAAPRLDLNPPQYNEWVFNFEWPNGGAAAGSQIVMNVDCKKGAP
jgi:hypothetical protein